MSDWRCRLRLHAWAIFGPWYGGWAMNRVCKRCGKHEGRYRARGDSVVLWHHVADDVDWQTYNYMQSRPALVSAPR